MQIGYCANVHPGRTLAEVQQSLTDYSLKVKSLASPNQSMGIGLWLSETVTRELTDQETCRRFADWLAEIGLIPFTFNGFPFGDFHQEVVKHKVYQPTWAETARLEYTLRLAKIQQQLLPGDTSGSISTLPLGWPTETSTAEQENFFQQCAKNLLACANQLARIESECGRRTMVCIEPEPGCWFDMCDDVTDFFQRYLLTGTDAQNEIVLRHLGVCHDVCHSAVMFEEQETAVRAYQQAGIQIGKVQLSSALEVNFEPGEETVNQQKLEQLVPFAEARYLHQTSVKVDGEIIYYEDLPIALHAESEDPVGQWRIHFHVPIFAEQLGSLATTQPEIQHCLRAIKESDLSVEHYEIETYAWNVLPAALQPDSLVQGIAQELAWCSSLQKT